MDMGLEYISFIYQKAMGYARMYENKISVVMAGHFSTEVVITHTLAEKLNALVPEIKFIPAKETSIVKEV